jgi:superfamily II DNA helicase RecQ
MPIKNYKFLENTDEVMQKLQHLKPTTRKAYLTCIVSCLNCYKDNKKLSKLCAKYYILMNDAVKVLKETPSSAMTKTQSTNWLDWNKIQDIYKSNHDKVMKFINNKELSETQYTQLLNFVVLSLYVLIPPRRNLDYMVMYIVKNKPTSKDKNYLIVDNNQFEFNVFKTAKKTEGESIEDIPEDLQHVIYDMYFKHHPLIKNKKITTKSLIPFLVYSDAKPLTTSNSITRILNKVFDKKIGVSMLRHSYLTFKYGDVNSEREKDAHAMGHNMATQQQYIKEK